MVDLEHPDITKANKTGYPEKEPECYGIDYFGDEILEGDPIIIFDGEYILEKNLDEFLRIIGFKFIIAGEEE